MRENLNYNLGCINLTDNWAVLSGELGILM
jgi:hypothetical protein